MYNLITPAYTRMHVLFLLSQTRSCTHMVVDNIFTILKSLKLFIPF